MSSTLEEFIIDIQNEKNFPLDEASVKQSIVLKVLSLLSWDVFNSKEVIPEYSVKGKRVDYCLSINMTPRIFVEVKNSNEDLNNSKHQEQLVEYAFHEGIELAILTNGKSWEFYLPMTKGSSWEQRKFFTIDLVQQEVGEIVKNFTSFLLKENIISGESFKKANSYLDSRLKQQLIDKNLPKAWNKLISENDELLIELVNESLEGLCGIKAENEKVAQFIHQNESRFLILEHQFVKVPEVHRKGSISSKKDLVYTRSGYTGKRITSFTFNHQTHYVSSWVKFLIKISEVIYSEKKDIFNKVETLRGRKRKYYSTNKNEVVKPGKIGGTGYYVDTNLSANMIVKLVGDVLALFSYRKDSLKIICSD